MAHTSVGDLKIRWPYISSLFKQEELNIHGTMQWSFLVKALASLCFCGCAGLEYTPLLHVFFSQLFNNCGMMYVSSSSWSCVSEAPLKLLNVLECSTNEYYHLLVVSVKFKCKTSDKEVHVSHQGPSNCNVSYCGRERFRHCSWDMKATWEPLGHF